MNCPPHNHREVLVSSCGRFEIIEVTIPPKLPERLEHYCLYEIPGYRFSFLDATRAWAKAEELANDC